MAWECEDCGYPGCGDANCLDNRESLQDEIRRIAAENEERRNRLSVEAAEHPNLLKGDK